MIVVRCVNVIARMICYTPIAMFIAFLCGVRLMIAEAETAWREEERNDGLGMPN